MLLVDNVDDTAFLKVLVEAIYPELSDTRKKEKQNICIKEKLYVP
ncbi:MAG: hypothetical protein ACI4KB_12190 [Oscillospiraceae bacterium]